MSSHRLISSAVPATVVIPSWNGRHLLETCLEGLVRSTVAAQIIVVDNGSQDGTAAWLASVFPSIVLIRNARNLGFAVAVNQGIQASDGQWIALLNNDAVPAPDWLESLLQVGLADSDIGSVASRMMFRNAPTRVSSAGIQVDVSGGAWDNLMGEYRWPARPIEVFGASGGACLLRKDMLSDVGLFDAGFFAYFEDVDLAWRARLRGWRSVLAPDAIVHHAVSATVGDSSPFKRYFLARNKWRTIVRTYPLEGLRLYFPAIVTYDALAIAQALAKRWAAPLRGRLNALRTLPELLAERRAIQARRSAPWSDLHRALAPLPSPLALYRRVQMAARLSHKQSE